MWMDIMSPDQIFAREECRGKFHRLWPLTSLCCVGVGSNLVPCPDPYFRKGSGHETSSNLVCRILLSNLVFMPFAPSRYNSAYNKTCLMQTKLLFFVCFWFLFVFFVLFFFFFCFFCCCCFFAHTLLASFPGSRALEPGNKANTL